MARNLRGLREAKGVSQFSLAKHAGVSQTYISQIEGATRNVSIEILQELADALNIDVHELLLP